MEKTIKLSNGVDMPIIGFGTYPLQGKVLYEAMLTALESGCRLIDTAHSYPNEESIGEQIQKIFRETEFKREDIFLTSKIGDKLDSKGNPIGYYFYNSDSCPNKNHRDVVFKQLGESLRRLKTDYVDLLLIHWPYYDCLEEIWDAFEEVYRQGKARSIGVSNFRTRHLERISKGGATVMPMVNQIYVSPLNIQEKMIEYAKNHPIVIESYSPIKFLHTKNSVTTSRKIQSLCTKYGKSLAQITLRWNLQRKVIPIPKSGTPSRVKDNYDIFDFELTQEEVSFINSFNENYQYLPESRYCPGY